MSKFKTVFFFHLREGLIAKSTLILSTILFVLVVGLSGLQKLTSSEEGSKKEKDHLIFINETSNYTIDQISFNKSLKTAVVKKSNSSELKSEKKKVDDGTVDGLIVISEKNSIPVINYTYKKFPNDEVMAMFSATLQQVYLNKTAKELNLSPDAAAKLLAKVEVREDVLKDPMATFGIAYFFGFLLYMFLLIYGNSIATGVVSEKSSRVMEVILPKVNPVITLYGRVLAVFFVALAQLAVLGIGFLFSYLLGWVNLDKLSLFGMNIDLSLLDVGTVLAFITYFLLGYFLYGMLYAAIGSVVSKTEELQMVLMPITFLIIAAFFISINALMNPNGTLVKVSSFFPFFSPLVAFSRFVAGEMNSIEIISSILILIVTIAIITRIASRIYVNGVMFYSEKVKWKDIARLVKRH